MKTEALLVGFKVLLDKKGRLLIERSGLPLEDVDAVFKKLPEYYTYKVLIQECEHKLEELINHLEKELSSV